MQVGPKPFFPLSAFCDFQWKLRKLFWRVFCCLSVAIRKPFCSHMATHNSHRMLTEWLYNVNRKETERQRKGNRKTTEQQQKGNRKATERQQKGNRKATESLPKQVYLFSPKITESRKGKERFWTFR